MNEICYVTGNKGKFEEVSRFLASSQFPVKVNWCFLELEEIQSLDQKEIALHKAKQAWQILKKPVLVDDSGCYFDKYYQFPGTLTKFVYQGIGLEGIFKLVEPGDKAEFRLYLVYYEGPEHYKIFTGVTKGYITLPHAMKADDPLPYKYLFIPDTAQKSLAELEAEHDDAPYNHRIKALKDFINWYSEQNN